MWLILWFAASSVWTNGTISSSMPRLSAQIDGMAERLRREVANTYLHQEQIVRLNQRSMQLMNNQFEFMDPAQVQEVRMREAGGRETSRTYSNKQCRDIPLQAPSAYM